MSDTSDDEPETPAKSEGGDDDDSSDVPVIDPRPTSRRKPKDGLTTADLLEADVQSGFEVVSTMTPEHLNKLINRLERQCSPHDVSTVFVRMKRMIWTDIAFDHFSAENCRVAWIYVKSQTRKHRIMHEIIQEVKISAERDMGTFRTKLIETAPGFPTRPPSSNSALFVREMWKKTPDHQKTNFFIFQREALDGFQNLSKFDKANWEHKLKKLADQYEKDVKEFYSKYPNYKREAKPKRSKYEDRGGKKKEKAEKPARAHPRQTTNSEQIEHYPDAPTPPKNVLAEFIQSKMNAIDPAPSGKDLTDLKAKYNSKWQKLSDRKKGKWSDVVLKRIEIYSQELKEYKEQHPNYVAPPIKIRGLLSNADIDNWASRKGMPEKPANNVFELFFRNKKDDPAYAHFGTVEEAKRAAEEEFKTLGEYGKEMLKIENRRAILEYKKDIEEFFDKAPDILKPKILQRVPKKFHSVVAAHVEKIPLDMILDEEDKLEERLIEEKEQDQEVYHEEGPPPKKKKKSKAAVAEKVETNVLAKIHFPFKPAKNPKKSKEGFEQLSIEDPITNGSRRTKRNSLFQQKNIDPPTNLPQKKPTSEDFTQGQSPTKRNIDDMIRGIFDASPELGRNYSVFYYYAKYVARDGLWIRQLEAVGLVETAQKIYTTFLGLSEHKKTIFVDQSWDWHELTKGCRPNRPINTTRDTLMPGEPEPPPRNAFRLYNRDMTVLKRRKKIAIFPKWAQIGEEIQHVYMKKLYRENRKYVTDYENYMMKLTPEEFASYTLFQSRMWERRVLLSNPLRGAWRSFIFPLPGGIPRKHGDYDVADESDTEILEEPLFGARNRHNRLHSNLPSVLDNDDYIRRVANNTQREKLSTQELMDIADESSDEDTKR